MIDKLFLAITCLGIGFALGASAASSDERDEDNVWNRLLDLIPFRVKAGAVAGAVRGGVRAARK